ncbi:MAG: anthrax toxin lethal factor-related metalloendopeptidase [Fimbriiglobus sp.]
MKRLGCLLFCMMAVSVYGQAPAVKTAGPKIDEKSKIKIPEYKVYKIQGFTVLIHDSVMSDAAMKYEKQPLDVLDGELATIVSVMSPKSVDVLRRLVIWVEWEDTRSLENGRSGVSVAVYRGGSAEAMLVQGLHPLKAKTIDVLNMKSLTEEHQPKKNSGRCVLLHEFAHAVHDQILTMDHPGIKAAYTQAMERKLYDQKTHYAATNVPEFFAELSCCYLDTLHYFPNNRDDLKKHDPATFKLMETIWAGSAKKGTVAAKAVTPSAELSLTLGEIKWGQHIAGAKFEPSDVKDRVLAVVYWGGESSNVLDHFVKLHKELGPYGLQVVAPFPFVRPAEAIAKDAKARGSEFAVFQGAFVPMAGQEEPVNQKPPHTIVFDTDGTCIYRGSGFNATTAIRVAIGKKLLMEVSIDELPKAFKPVQDAFTAGTAPLAVLPKLSPLLTSSDEPTKKLALSLQEKILAPGKAMLAELEAQAKVEPVLAYYATEEFTAQFKGTPFATKGNSLLEKLRSKAELAPELRAKPSLTAIQKLHGQIMALEGAFEPTSPRFQSRNAAAINQLERMILEMKTKHPKARATVLATKLGRDLGLPE